MSNLSPVRVQKSTIFGNWVDSYGYPLTNWLLPYVAKYSRVSPNMVTIVSFLLYVIGCLLLFLPVPGHLFYASILLPIAYIGDQLDGQLARYTKQTTHVGDFLDKVLDILKVFIIMSAIAYSQYAITRNALYIFLGYVAAFFFMLRYYIKLETVLQRASIDSQYLAKCSQTQNKLENTTIKRYRQISSEGVGGKIKVWFMRNSHILAVDEGEFVFFTVVGIVINRLDIVLFLFAISQVIIGFWRFFQRGYQIKTNSKTLFNPLRK